MIRGSGKRPAVRWLLLLSLLLLVVTAFWGFKESWNGIRPVASTLSSVVLPMTVLVVISLVIAILTHRSKAGWGLTGVATMTVLVVLLAAFGGFSIYRGHTAAERFADDINRFPVPTGFQIDAAATATATSEGNQAQYVVRVWRSGETFAPECPAVKKAVEKWNDGPVPSLSSVCTYGVGESNRNFRLELKGNVLTLQMWLEKASAFTF